MEEITAILRGADELIMSGGRNMLTKILTGSKDKKLLDLELDHCPVYGAFKGKTQKEILEKIDWMIVSQYLDIDYDYRLPLLIFTDKGWKIEQETCAEELFEELIEAAHEKRYEFVQTLKDRNRGMIVRLLDKIAESRNDAFIRILEEWKRIDYKKVRTRIQTVIEQLKKKEGRMPNKAVK